MPKLKAHLSNKSIKSANNNHAITQKGVAKIGRGGVRKVHPLPSSPASLKILRRDIFGKVFGSIRRE